MKIRDLYAKYQIMPQLETHMLRVSGVGKIIAEHWRGKCDVQLVTDLCLLHDMGNIVKFDLSGLVDKKFYGKFEDLGHWQEVQKEFWHKYGKNAQIATVEILKEAKLDRYIPYIIEEERLYFSEPTDVDLEKSKLESIILMYADCRVTPTGVVSYRERIDDLKARYGGVGTESWSEWTYWFEIWMQSKTDIDLNQITEKSVESLYEELLGYNI